MSGAPVPPPEDNPDQGVPWHFGDPLREQRQLVAGSASVDLSNRGVVTVRGPDRLSWLHSLTTQGLEGLAPGESSLALILSPHGHVEHELHAIDDGECTWLIVQPGTAEPLLDHLRSMQFMLRVEVEDRSQAYGVVWEPVWEADPEAVTWLVPRDFAGQGRVDAGADRGGDSGKYVGERPSAFAGREVVVPADDVPSRLGAFTDPAGSWALEALRVAAAVPRLGLDTDHRTLPHEVGWIGSAVHLDKGCYRGQETVARVHNLGHPPRRLVLLHLDGSDEHLPAHGSPVIADGREVGWLGTSAWHYELGPIATAVIKRSVPVDAPVMVSDAAVQLPATQETVVLP